MLNRPATFACVLIALACSGCTTIYRYDAAGNLTCIASGGPSSTGEAPAPPTVMLTPPPTACPTDVDVTLANDDAYTTIHYTLDDSQPTPSSPVYAGPLRQSIAAQSALTVRAIAVDRCAGVSSVAVKAYKCPGSSGGGGPAPSVVLLSSDIVSHWFDFFFFWKKSYTDLVYEGAVLPAGCTVEDFDVNLFERDGSVRYAAGPNFAEATNGATGVNLVDFGTTGSRRLQMTVNSWHTFGSAVRYQIVFRVRGTGCTLPPFSVRRV